MSSIVVQDLASQSISGTIFSDDSESFIQELTEGDLLSINGGNLHIIVPAIAVTAVIFYALGALAGASTCN
jgi:hypothetical protein